MTRVASERLHPTGFDSPYLFCRISVWLKLLVQAEMKQDAGPLCARGPAYATMQLSVLCRCGLLSRGRDTVAGRLRCAVVPIAVGERLCSVASSPAWEKKNAHHHVAAADTTPHVSSRVHLAGVVPGARAGARAPLYCAEVPRVAVPHDAVPALPTHRFPAFFLGGCERRHPPDL